MVGWGNKNQETLSQWKKERFKTENKTENKGSLGKAQQQFSTVRGVPPSPLSGHFLLTKILADLEGPPLPERTLSEKPQNGIFTQ